MPAGASTEGESATGIGPGRVVLVVGPSGAGKDAVLREVARRLAQDSRFLFPTRIVTREASLAEAHDTLTPAEFSEQLAAGRFALHWQAHGLQYAIPSAIDNAVRQGMCVVFNTSRSIVGNARARYLAATIVMIDAPLHVRASRLAERNREPREEVELRLARTVAGFDARDADLVIDNAGPLAHAAERLAAWLLLGQAELAAALRPGAI